LVLCVINLFA